MWKWIKEIVEVVGGVIAILTYIGINWTMVCEILIDVCVYILTYMS